MEPRKPRTQLIRASNFSSMTPVHSSPDRLHLALHEAGHAVVLNALGYPIEYVSITDGGDWTHEARTPLGIVLPATTQVHVAVAGWMAVYNETKDFTGSVAGCRGDLELLQQSSKQLEGLYRTQYQPIGEYVVSCRNFVLEIIRRRWDAVHAVAGALLAKGVLTGHDVAELIREHLPPSEIAGDSPRVYAGCRAVGDRLS